MFTSDSDKLELLFEGLRKRFSEETVREVQASIAIDPIHAQGCAITKKGYLELWKQSGVVDAIEELSDLYGINWTHTSEWD